MKSLGPSAVNLDHHLVGEGCVCVRIGVPRSEASMLEATTSQKSYRNEEVKIGFDRSSVSFLHSRKRMGRPWLQNWGSRSSSCGVHSAAPLASRCENCSGGCGSRRGPSWPPRPPSTQPRFSLGEHLSRPSLWRFRGEGRGLTPCSGPGQFAHCSLGPQRWSAVGVRLRAETCRDHQEESPF